MTIRYSDSGMSIWDDRILEVLDDHGDPASVGWISDQEPLTRTSKSTVSRRCSHLEEMGLLRRYGPGVYGIGDRGSLYLSGDLDAKTLSVVDKED